MAWLDELGKLDFDCKDYFYEIAFCHLFMCDASELYGLAIAAQIEFH
jgi:hypothetical protein